MVETGFALTAPDTMISTADISECGRYRYSLGRSWDRQLPAATFVLLNPSTADASVDDPTVRRLIGFSRSWGMGSLRLLNLFAFRATEPLALRRTIDPIGPNNDEAIWDAAIGAATIICAWGKHGTFRNRQRVVLSIIRDAGAQPHYLRLNDDGTPAHPLYLPGDLRPALWGENADG